MSIKLVSVPLNGPTVRVTLYVLDVVEVFELDDAAAATPARARPSTATRATTSTIRRRLMRQPFASGRPQRRHRGLGRLPKGGLISSSGPEIRCSAADELLCGHR